MKHLTTVVIILAVIGVGYYLYMVNREKAQQPEGIQTLPPGVLTL